MRPSKLLRTIEEQRILEQNESDEYRITEDLQTSIQNKKSVLRDHLHDENGYPINGEKTTITEQNIEFYANYLALDHFLPIDSTDQIAKVSLILSWFQRGIPATQGTPEPFLSIHGDQLPVILELYSPAIVYIWRHDCDPCEILKEDLEDIFEDQEQIGLFSIYGPDHSQYLHDTYNIVGGPTTLFIANGQIDSRLQGAHEPQLIRREFETIQSRSK